MSYQPPFPANSATDTLPPFSRNALYLITSAEGVDQPGKWPGGASGISLGHGYDLGSETADELRIDWKCLGADAINSLLSAVGKSGHAAEALASRFQDIRIARADADRVFMLATLPKYTRLTRLAYPQVNQLPLDAQGALVSLVYNRGGGMGSPGEASWDQRREMRAIQAVLRDGVQAGDLVKIAAQIRSMKRLWEGKGLDGLLARREAEACLVEQAG